MKKAIEANIEIIDRCLAIINVLPLKDFVKPCSVILDETIGRHFRHIIEFYISLLKDINTGIVSYDSRERNKQLETEIKIVSEKLKQIKMKLSGLSTDQKILLKYNLFTDSNYLQTAESTLKRELIFLHDHTIHHLFMIRIASENLSVKNLLNIDDLGINPSTLRSRKCAL